MTALNRTRSVPILVLLLSTFAAGQDPGKDSAHAKQGSVVVFVCEHGSAKNVIAAAYFNKLAKEQNLKMQAVSRGTTLIRKFLQKLWTGFGPMV